MRGFGDGAFFAMPAAKFEQRLRNDGAFEVKVQLGFGKGLDKAEGTN